MLASSARVPAAGFEPRAVCARCRRPEVTCYCAHLPRLESRTRLLILQHRRERDMAIGTAHMASLCVEGAALHVGVDFENDAEVQALLRDPARPAYILYPSPGAIDVDQAPPPGPITLVVVDGTWSLAKKLLRVNPALAALPRLAFSPRAPSNYRIRREPQENYVSTIEATAHVLGALEGDPTRFDAMLEPFRAMVDAQIDHRTRLAVSRHRRHRPATRDPGRGLPTLLRERPDDLVHVVSGASAWPRRPGVTPTDDLVQWVAFRPSTGEHFEALAAPVHPLAPSFPHQTELDPDEILRAPPLPALLDRWAAFVRPTDVVCSWGVYGISLLMRSGGAVPGEHLDLRVGASTWLNHRTGLVEDLASQLGVTGAPLGRGRAGRRLALLVGCAERMAAVGRGEAAR